MFKRLINYFIILIILQISLQAREINLNSLIDTLKNQNKHLMVWMHKTDCGYCDGMEEFTLQNDTVKEFIDDNFVTVHINISKKPHVIYKNFEGTGREFAKLMGYNLYPTTYFIDENADVVFTEVGYIDTKSIRNEIRFYKILNFINTKSYNETEYDDYEFEVSDEI